MSRFQNRITPICLMVLLALSGSLKAANDHQDNKKIYTPAQKITLTPEEEKADRLRREQIVSRTQHLFTLISAEMANNNGDVARSLSLYLNTLRETRDPEVAERAMEIAITERAYNVAETIYQMWREFEPTPSVAQQRLAWTRALALGDQETVFKDLDAVLAHADDTQRQRAFLMLAQISLVYPDFLKNGSSLVRKAASRYDHLIEANVANVLYSVNKESHAIKALQHLAKQDEDILPETTLTLSALAQLHPQLLNRFFEKTNTSKLSSAWRELEVENLINQAKYDEAAEKLSHLIGDDPKANLYFQAARLTMRRHPDDIDKVVGYFDKAYQVGKQDERAQAALNAALHLASKHRFAEAEQWATRIDSPKFEFDKATLRATIAAEQEYWQQARELAQTALKQPETQGTVFERVDANRISLQAISQTMPPAQVVAELTRQLAQAERDRKNPQYADNVSLILLQRGLVYADKLGQPEKAVADFRRYLTMNPSSAVAHNALGYTLLSINGKLDEALNLLKTAYEMSPQDVQISDSLGWAYFLKGDTEEALRLVSFAYEHDKDAEIATHLGEIYWKLGQQDKAREVWREAWETNQKRELLMQTLKRYGVTF
ncbi:tetratricopeptide repeat protein [Wielerella bovis]|uniref:tetratricopeptide repeat protein n=1 Tax=Wielerella bovis TaxID=2917790 RepID=UPI002019BFBC|nr:tetratricopeptide repeat protein [Wielerella bovis]MCG7658048.1 tetratricopeptide repeat protein [Wielerella bovis]MCG7660270.1 tetratricopeptide repeat protein [Wielerella bovis]